MNFSSGGRGEQGGRGPIPRLSSGEQSSPEESSPNKAIKPKFTRDSRISPSKSFQKRISQREGEPIGTKFRSDEAISSSSSKEDVHSLAVENDTKPLISSRLRKASIGSKSDVSRTFATLDDKDSRFAGSRSKDFSPDHDIIPVSRSNRTSEDTKRTHYRFTAPQRRTRSLDGADIDEIISREILSPMARRTKSEDDVVDNARRPVRITGRRRSSTGESPERRIPSRSFRTLVRRDLVSSNDFVKERERFAGSERTNDEEGRRSSFSSPARSATGNSVARMLRSSSTGEFSGGSLIGGDASSVGLNQRGERDVPLVDTIPSALRTPEKRYRRQRVALPAFLFDPVSDKSPGAKTPFSTKLMESTSSDSSEQRLARNKEGVDVRFQANLPSCPSVSTFLADSCVVLFDGAPNLPQRTVDDLEAGGLEPPREDESKSKSEAPLSFISFFLNEENDERSSITVESLEDDNKSVSSYCPSIADCISTGTSMADEAPKMPGRGVSQLSMESGNALGEMDDDKSAYESLNE